MNNFNQEIPLKIRSFDAATTDGKDAEILVLGNQVIEQVVSGFMTFETTETHIGGSTKKVWVGKSWEDNRRIIKPEGKVADIYTATGAKGTGLGIMVDGEVLGVIPNQSFADVDHQSIAKKMERAGIPLNAEKSQTWLKLLLLPQILSAVTEQSSLPGRKKITLQDVTVHPVVTLVASEMSGRKDVLQEIGTFPDEWPGFTGLGKNGQRQPTAMDVERVFKAAGLKPKQYSINEVWKTADQNIHVAGDYSVVLQWYSQQERLGIIPPDVWLLEHDTVGKGALSSDGPKEGLTRYEFGHAYAIERRTGWINPDVIFKYRLVVPREGHDKYQDADDAANRGMEYVLGKKYFYFPYSNRSQAGLFVDIENGVMSVNRIRNLANEKRDGWTAAAYTGTLINFYSQFPGRDLWGHGGMLDVDTQKTKRRIAAGVARSQGVTLYIIKAHNPALMHGKIAAGICLDQELVDPNRPELVTVSDPYDLNDYRKTWEKIRAKLHGKYGC